MDKPGEFPCTLSQGSLLHPNGCKPCNKFPSCKHGQNCSFCHADHERPKHRGQRGRHALQRRQYLDARAHEPTWFVVLVDEIYRRPHEHIERVKESLNKIRDPNLQLKKALDVIDRIHKIGEDAQNARPDSNTVKPSQSGQAFDPTGIGPQQAIAEIESKCKWLIGTLHLMVRKMKDRMEDPILPDQAQLAEAERKVYTALRESERLYQVVESRSQSDVIVQPRPKPLPWVDSATQKGLQSISIQSLKSTDKQWLCKTISALAMEEKVLRESDKYNECVIAEIQKVVKECECLSKSQVLPPVLKAQLQQAKSLAEFANIMAEKYMDLLTHDLFMGLKETPKNEEEMMEFCQVEVDQLPATCDFVGKAAIQALQRGLKKHTADSRSLEVTVKKISQIVEAATHIPRIFSVFESFGIGEEAVKSLEKRLTTPELQDLDDLDLRLRKEITTLGQKALETATAAKEAVASVYER